LPDAILITRPEPGASATAARLRAAGMEPVVAPFLAIRSIAARLPAPGPLQAVLAASGNAVDRLPPAYHLVTLLTVGDATAARAKQAGFVTVHSADGDAAAMAALATARLDPAAGPLLLAAGQGQSKILAADLRRRGFRVLRRVVYTASRVTRFPMTAQTAIRKGLRAAMFFSTETAEAFAHLLPNALAPALAGTDALAIGEAAGHRPEAERLCPLQPRGSRLAQAPRPGAAEREASSGRRPAWLRRRS
jgi:uroporphyrinogen-III synthase